MASMKPLGSVPSQAPKSARGAWLGKLALASSRGQEVHTPHRRLGVREFQARERKQGRCSGRQQESMPTFAAVTERVFSDWLHLGGQWLQSTEAKELPCAARPNRREHDTRERVAGATGLILPERKSQVSLRGNTIQKAFFS